jgi:apolipoprotein N-acyltransferase
VVWPESAVPYRLDEHHGYREVVETLARRQRVDLLVGTLTEAGGGGLHNSAALIRQRGGVATVSSKRQLVPFGEYLPLRAVFSRARALAAEAGDFVPGSRIVLHPVGGQRVACLICYEAVFPELAAEAVAAGADLLVNMTNDSWFGWTSGPRQHLMHAMLRAAETGRPLVRAANSGISVVVGADGRLLERLELGERGAIVAEVRAGGDAAPGHRVGGWLALACATLSVVALGAAWLPWRHRRRRPVDRQPASEDPRIEPEQPSDRKTDA